MKHLTNLTKDLENKRMFITREFSAPLATVWQAWTDPEILDKWWAPKPWRAETKTMDFREGGTWLYCMVGPEGERHWAKANYKTIAAPENYSYSDSFCDENGVENKEAPSMNWHNVFTASADGTKVEIEITFDSVGDLEKIIEMGFSEGFTMAHDNLDALLAANK